MAWKSLLSCRLIQGFRWPWRWRQESKWPQKISLLSGRHTGRQRLSFRWWEQLLFATKEIQNWAFSCGRENHQREGDSPTMTTPALECWAAITAHGDVQLEILKGFDTQWKTPEGVPGLRVTYVAWRPCVTELFFYQQLTVCRGQHAWLLRELTNVRAIRQISWAVSHFRPLFKQLRSLSALPFHSGFKLNKVTDHHKGNIHIIVWGKNVQMELFTLLCLDYKQIFTPVLGLQLMEELSSTIWNRHIFILFITSSHFSCRLPRLKIKWRRRKERNILWIINHKRKIAKLVELITNLWYNHFCIHQLAGGRIP